MWAELIQASVTPTGDGYAGFVGVYDDKDKMLFQEAVSFKTLDEAELLPIVKSIYDREVKIQAQKAKPLKVPKIEVLK